MKCNTFFSSILLCLILILSSHVMMSQKFQIGLSYGNSDYLGDIKPALSGPFASNNEAFSFHIGYNINRIWAIKGQFSSTKISGKDENKSNIRNLSFESPVDEVACMVDVEFSRYITQLKESNFQAFVVTGIAGFIFDPRTYYDGNWYRLQPLSTEGQGLPGSNVKSYSRLSVSLPIGGGLRYYFTDHISLEFSIIARKTYTDYLDDVSGYYYDPEQLLLYKGEIAQKLAYRSDEIPEYVEEVKIGNQRGNSANKDWYFVNSFAISYKF